MTKQEGSGSQQRPEPEFLEVGRVLRPWGVRGDVKVELLSSRPDDLAPGQRIFLGEASRPYEVHQMRVQGRALIVKLIGCDSPEQAEALRSLVIRIQRSAAAPLRPNEYYHHQIIGLSVLTLEGDDLGKVVHILETGANDVYIVRGPRGEVLLPARKEVVRQIDLEAGIMRVSLLPGLLPE